MSEGDQQPGALIAGPSVQDYLGRLLQIGPVSSGRDWSVLVEKFAPWAELAAEGLLGAQLPLQFTRRLLSRWLGENEPNALGLIACTIAYQRAIQQAIPEVLGSAPPSAGQVRRELRAQMQREYDFTSFTLSAAHQHPFVKDANHVVEAFVEVLELHGSWPTRLSAAVQRRFVPNLRLLLSHGQTGERFAPFFDLISMEAASSVVQEAVSQHLEYQRARFEDLPVLGREPFSLAQIYVEPTCNPLTVAELQGGVHPFDAKQHRAPIHRTVEALLTGPDYAGPVFIQGPAGSGKSSFSLRLCVALADSGLRPLRVELRHLDSRARLRIEETLPRALQLASAEGEVAFFTQAGRHEADFMQLFEERMMHRGTKLCPYVLILDGWDELPMGGDTDLRNRLQTFLIDLQESFLAPRAPHVRTLLVGRPSELLTDSGIMRPESTLVSLLPWNVQQLELFYGRVAAALAAGGHMGDGSRWTLPPPAIIERLIELRRQGFDLLGSPLLAHLCLRLLGERMSEGDAAQMVAELSADPTSLHRRLTDLVVAKSGKDPEADFSPRATAMFSGQALRQLLHRTAEAMTVLLRENIGRDELCQQLRLGDDELDQQLAVLEGEERLSRLMISFFFRSGHRGLGCEFSHKSFREYLYSERVVEILKTYGRLCDDPRFQLVPRRYHADFAEADPRGELVRALMHALGSSGLRPEEEAHIQHLLHWEINRARVLDGVVTSGTSGAAVEPCGRQQWIAIRDGLVAAWEHWNDGALLRSQADPRMASPRPPQVSVVADRVRPPDGVQPAPRISTLDAHYGYGLFRLTSWVHGYLLDSSAETGHEQAVLNRFQRSRDGQVVFRPSGHNPKWLGISACRIAAVGYRVPHSPRLLRGAFLPYADLAGVVMQQQDLRDIALNGADLQDAKLAAVDLRGADLTGAALARVDLRRSNLEKARFSRADLREADLREAMAKRVCLTDSDLSNAKLDGAMLRSAELLNAQLVGAQLQDARLERALLTGANLSHANLRDAVLRDANLRGANCRAADFHCAILRGIYGWGGMLQGANLEGADLSGADLGYADLRGANLKGANLRGACLRNALLEGANFADALSHKTEIATGALTTEQCRNLADQGAGIVWCDEER